MTEPTNPEFHQCPECGYVWAHGQDGSHSCVANIRKQQQAIDTTTERLDKVIAKNDMEFLDAYDKELMEQLVSRMKVLGFDEGHEDCKSINMVVNITTMAKDESVAKYNHLSDAMMGALFSKLKFKDTFEIERAVNGFVEAARSHGSAAMIRIRKH